MYDSDRVGGGRLRALRRFVWAPIRLLDDLGIFSNAYLSGGVTALLACASAVSSAFAERNGWEGPPFVVFLLASMLMLAFAVGLAHHQWQRDSAAKALRVQQALDSVVPLVELLTYVREQQRSLVEVQRQVLRHISKVVADSIARQPVEVNATWSILLKRSERSASFPSVARAWPLAGRAENSTFTAQEPDPGAWQALTTFEPSTIHDTQVLPLSFSSDRQARYRSVLAVPVFTHGDSGQEFVGLLSVDHKAPAIFTDSALGAVLTPLAIVIGVCEHLKSIAFAFEVGSS